MNKRLINLPSGRVFKWASADEAEVYGWLETEEGDIIKGTAGWWRTTDPEVAAKIAEETY